MTDHSEVTSVPAFNLERYLGTWFEIGRLPLKWEDESARDVTATYSLNPDGSVRVDNRCMDENDKPSQSIGLATPTDLARGQLEVSFLPTLLRWIPFTKGDYWVLKLDPDYQYALVGTPDRENLWFLARGPAVESEIEEEFLAAAQAQGFDLTQWIRPSQSGHTVSGPGFDAS